jgi:hypothetical protein
LQTWNNRYRYIDVSHQISKGTSRPACASDDLLFDCAGCMPHIVSAHWPAEGGSSPLTTKPGR